MWLKKLLLQASVPYFFFLSTINSICCPNSERNCFNFFFFLSCIRNAAVFIWLCFTLFRFRKKLSSENKTMDLCGIAEGGATANTFSIFWEKLLKNELSLKKIIQILKPWNTYPNFVLKIKKNAEKMKNP